MFNVSSGVFIPPRAKFDSGHTQPNFDRVMAPFYAPFEEEGVYCFADVGRSIGRSVRWSVRR